MRTVTEIESRFGMGCRDPAQEFLRIETDAGEFVADAVGCVQGNSVKFGQERLLDTVLFHLPV